jgi:hypothetical protein
MKFKKTMTLTGLFLAATFLLNGVILSEVLLEEDFDAFVPEEKTWPPAGWMIANGADDMQPPRWWYGTTPHSGVYHAYTDTPETGLTSCALMRTVFSTVPMTDPVLSFYYRGGLNSPAT